MVRAWLGMLLFTCALAVPEHACADEPQMMGLINDPRIAEISGMAASTRHPGILWVHNDSDDQAVVYALNERAEVVASILLDDAVNLDWEDMASWQHDGRHYLLIGDTGDNGGLRRELTLYAIEEPAELRDQRAAPAWRQRFRWPDGPRDCEAMAVDPRNGDVLLISKKRVPPELFRLRRSDDPDAIAEAERIGLLAGIDQPTAADLRRNPVYGRYRAQITSAAIDPAARALVVLNYRVALVYPRTESESWGQAVTRQPDTVNYPWLPQAEAVSFSADGGSVFIASERIPSPLIRLSVER